MRERALIDLFAAMEKLRGPSYECRYYPCHFEGQDCSLCFCPFYPCFIYRLGGDFVRSSKGSLVWSCKNCRWVHEKESVEEIVTYFSSFPRQRLVEEDWYFYSRALQEIIFGEELGEWIGASYSLVKANMGRSPSGECIALLVKMCDFDIVSVREVRVAGEEGILVPVKRGDKLLGIHEGCP
ncbi:MAG: cysteine-rich small domain-containing protein [Archaeoglobaceae archaeon]